MTAILSQPQCAKTEISLQLETALHPMMIQKDYYKRWIGLQPATDVATICMLTCLLSVSLSPKQWVLTSLHNKVSSLNQTADIFNYTFLKDSWGKFHSYFTENYCKGSDMSNWELPSKSALIQIMAWCLVGDKPMLNLIDCQNSNITCIKSPNLNVSLLVCPYGISGHAETLQLVCYAAMESSSVSELSIFHWQDLHGALTLLCWHWGRTFRDLSVDAPSQWETTSHCNVVSHWLGAYTKWSLNILSP